MINLPIFFILQGFSALFGCGLFVLKILSKRKKKREKSVWYKIWYKSSKSAFQKRVEAVSKFKIFKPSKDILGHSDIETTKIYLQAYCARFSYFIRVSFVFLRQKRNFDRLKYRCR